MSTETLRYGTDHALQTVTVTTLNTTTTDGYWVILIHGGAWRDPTQTSTSYLSPVHTILTTTPAYATTTQNITALASISYRLSAHPSHTQDPATTSPYDFRAAKHPDHVDDVRAAIAFLQKRYGFGGRYVLVGHSCGATLGFQVVMGGLQKPIKTGGGVEGQDEGEGEGEGEGPVAIVGMAGIYDLRLLRDCHRSVSVYQDFIVGAFGSNEALWDRVSPAKGGRLAVLAYSNGDGSVDSMQREAMREALREWEAGREGRTVEMLNIEGDHDDAWEKGDELARAIAFAVDKLRG
ncbi:hypothetical protein BO70DRAFT_387446 [Aspergillus heteromorphus CBS 117.55]|uniref:Kynurenine formamidase n=1 Tax=Aspergillus heteromorphus CBS 117.55 TaxID=1448321 RepID=A0A317W9H8_9EURO|nr:uncharacterized protein BO70DRAFT_387446 [Aspergillus heteromorphus CBS 117.55]PWY81902.1 hypothetical protein BO70DRAFT_387446 [Aspergillus heteromorphus CBS 117.55]